MLDRTQPAMVGVTDQADGLVREHGRDDEVDRVLQGARDGAVVLGGDEDVGVEAGQGLVPRHRGRVLRGGHHRGHFLGEDRKIEVGELEDLGLDPLDGARLLGDPAGDAGADAVGTDRAGDDGKTGHGSSKESMRDRSRERHTGY